MKILEVSVGGWFQRTILDLAEIYDFVSEGTSPLELDKAILSKNRAALNISDFSMTVGQLESVVFTTHDGIMVKIFEDGLITLRLLSPATETKESISKLTNYYESILSPAISYIFSRRKRERENKR